MIRILLGVALGWWLREVLWGVSLKRARTHGEAFTAGWRSAGGAPPTALLKFDRRLTDADLNLLRQDVPKATSAQLEQLWPGDWVERTWPEREHLDDDR